MARRYQPQARPRLGATLAVAAIAVCAAALAAVALHLLRRFADPILLGPLVCAYGIGLAVAWGVRTRALGAPRLAGALAAAAATAGLWGATWIDYQVEHRSLRAELDEALAIRTGVGSSPAEHLRDERDERLSEHDYGSHLRRHLGLEGTVHPAAGGRAQYLGSAGAIAVTLLELIAGGFLAFAIGRAEARHPMCPRCHRWRTARLLGTVRAGQGEVIERALLGDGADTLEGELAAPDTREDVQLLAMTCPQGHDEGAILRILERRLDKRRHVRARTALDLELDQRELDALERALDAGAPA